MTIEELKNEIENKTGIPAAILAGETGEEIIANSKALLALKRENAIQQPQTAREQFNTWYNAMNGITSADEAGTALAEIESNMKEATQIYPRIDDNGEAPAGDGRPTHEKFASWFNDVSAGNLF